MKPFPEAAIRKRLEDGYRHHSPRHGRGVVMFDEAVKDVAACLAEIDALREYAQTIANGNPVPWNTPPSLRRHA